MLESFEFIKLKITKYPEMIVKMQALQQSKKKETIQ